MKLFSSTTKLALGALLFVGASGLGAQTLTNNVQFPTGITYDGTYLYLSHDEGYRHMIRIDPVTGSVLTSIPLGGSPRDLVYDGAGHFLATDIGPCPASAPCGSVREIDALGNLMGTFPTPFRAGAIAFDGTHIYVGDTDSRLVMVFDRAGTPVSSFDSGLRPEGMVFDPATGNLRVITLFDGLLYEITTAGEFVRACESPYVPGPYGLGGITIVGSKFVIAQARVPNDPAAGTSILFLERGELVCTPSECAATEPMIENASTSTSVLWPPDQSMIDVEIDYEVVSLCDSATASLSITSNEGTSDDFEVVDANHVRLRATRSGTGSGRVYSITITAIDGGGDSTTNVVTVEVPHDRRR